MENVIRKTVLFEHGTNLVARVELKDFLGGSDKVITSHEFWNDIEAFNDSLKGIELEGNPKYDHVMVRNEPGLTDERAIEIFKQLNNI